MTIVDGDGHVWEDPTGISKFVPDMYKSKGPLPLGELFPPLDYFHFQIGKADPGAFSQPVLAGWQRFMDMNYFAPAHALGHPMGMMINLTSMVFNGVFDRFPNLRVAYLEGGVAWILPLLERFDRSYETQTPYDYTGRLVKLQPGETLRDYVIKKMKSGNIFVGSEGCEADLPYVCKVVGSQSFMFSSDFPHEVSPPDCKREIEELLELEGLTEAEKDGILHSNAERFYGLVA